MRLFIASPVVLDNYSSIKEDFKNIIEGKWVEEQNLHLTWVFLGELKDEKPIIDKLHEIPALEESIEIKELGYFGRPPRVFFARSKEKVLYEKAKQFTDSGFDIYRFQPHVTLCRIKTILDYKAYKEKLKIYRNKTLGAILPEISLYKSIFTTEKVDYQCRFKH